MEKRIPCELVQDLLPSYIEELTSPVTDQYIKEHLAECEACRAMHEAMKPDSDFIHKEEQEFQRKEIDYLKQVKKKSHRSVVIAVALCTLLALAWILGSPYVKGQPAKGDQVSYDYEVSDRQVALWAVSTDGGRSIQGIEVKEVEPGVVDYAFTSVKESPWSKPCVKSDYEASENIQQIRIDGLVVWNQGRTISRITSEVYQSRHLYVGDMPANGDTASALNLPYYLGNFTNELETSSQPYVWNLYMAKEYSSLLKEKMETRMRGYAYAMLAVIDNLDVVRFHYSTDEKNDCLLEVTKAQASKFAGNNIKEIGQDLCLLEELMQKTGLAEEAYFTEEISGSNSGQNIISLNLINLTEEELSAIGLDLYTGSEEKRKLVSSTQGINADESKIKIGQQYQFILVPEDFGMDQFDENQPLWASVSVTEVIPDGEGSYQSYEAEKLIPLTPDTSKTLTLKGSFSKGIFVD